MNQKAKKYLADLTAGGLLLQETSVIAESLLDNPSETTWRERITEENILQKKSPNTALRYAILVRNRILPLGDRFLSDLTSNSGQVFVQLTTLAAMLHTPAIPDFMSLVIADARRQYKTELPPNAWRDFIQDRGKIVPGMSELSESTLRKSGTNMIRILVESGYLESSRNKKFQPVYLMPETMRWLEKLDRPDFKNVMECTL